MCVCVGNVSRKDNPLQSEALSAARAPVLHARYRSGIFGFPSHVSRTLSILAASRRRKASYVLARKGRGANINNRYVPNHNKKETRVQAVVIADLREFVHRVQSSLVIQV